MTSPPKIPSEAYHLVRGVGPNEGRLFLYRGEPGVPWIEFTDAPDGALRFAMIDLGDEHPDHEGLMTLIDGLMKRPGMRVRVPTQCPVCARALRPLAFCEHTPEESFAALRKYGMIPIAGQGGDA